MTLALPVSTRADRLGDLLLDKAAGTRFAIESVRTAGSRKGGTAADNMSMPAQLVLLLPLCLVRHVHKLEATNLLADFLILGGDPFEPSTKIDAVILKGEVVHGEIEQ